MSITTLLIAGAVAGFIIWAVRKQADPEPITGTASWYGEKYRGARMSNCDKFNPDAMTGASWDYPLGTRVKVTHQSRSVYIVITDRGPTKALRAKGRVIDLSKAAFGQLAPTKRGVIEVSVVKVK